MTALPPGEPQRSSAGGRNTSTLKVGGHSNSAGATAGPSTPTYGQLSVHRPRSFDNLFGIKLLELEQEVPQSFFHPAESKGGR